MEALESFDLTSTRSLRFENFQLHEYQVARTEQTVWFHDLFTPSNCLPDEGVGVGGGGWLGAGTAQSRGRCRPPANPYPELVLEEALAPSCRDTLSLSRGTKEGLVLARRGAYSTCS